MLLTMSAVAAAVSSYLVNNFSKVTPC